ncbi:MAG: hypothetical protein C4310_09530, partial [Chloroflexota bacterium]
MGLAGGQPLGGRALGACALGPAVRIAPGYRYPGSGCLHPRLYHIGDIPYGIEGDEAKWTVEAATLAVDGQKVLDAEYHSFWLPVSFAMQAPFHHLLGPGIRAARIAVACFSLVATA